MSRVLRPWTMTPTWCCQSRSSNCRAPGKKCPRPPSSSPAAARCSTTRSGLTDISRRATRLGSRRPPDCRVAASPVARLGAPTLLGVTLLHVGLNLLDGGVLLVRGHGASVSYRIGQLAVAIAPEHVFGRHG